MVLFTYGLIADREDFSSQFSFNNSSKLAVYSQKIGRYGGSSLVVEHRTVDPRTGVRFSPASFYNEVLKWNYN